MSEIERVLDSDNFVKDLTDAFNGERLSLAIMLRSFQYREDDMVRDISIENIDGKNTVLFNRKFILENCKTREHLFVLVYHALLHVFFFDGTRCHNKLWHLVEDSLINSIIATEFPGKKFTSFFTNLYASDHVIYGFLRPNSRLKSFYTRRKYKDLYSFMISQDDMYLYFENILNDKSEEEIKDMTSDTLGSNTTSSDDIQHSKMSDVAEEVLKNIEDSQQKTLNDKVYNKKSRMDWNTRNKIAEQMQAGFSNNLANTFLKKFIKKAKEKKQLSDALIKASQRSDLSRINEIISKKFPKIPANTPIPNPRDRHSLVASELGIYRPFYKNPVLPKDFGLCYVYLDVSGSMSEYFEMVYNLMLSCKDFLHDKIFLFSNNIAEIDKKELKEGKIRTSYGTDFDCIVDHMRDHKEIKKCLIFTDGYAALNTKSREFIKKSSVDITAVFTPRHSATPLGDVCKNTFVLQQKK